LVSVPTARRGGSGVANLFPEFRCAASARHGQLKSYNLHCESSSRATVMGMKQADVIEALRAVPAGLGYVELASAVYGVYSGSAPTSAQLGNVRRAVSALKAFGVVVTGPAEAVHARAGRPSVVVRLG
jgi:hypothetical protein